jgi:hypothetical protein
VPKLAAGLVMAMVGLLAGCRTDRTDPVADAPPPPTSSPFAAALPSPADLGPGYDEVPVEATGGPCSLSPDEPARQAQRGFVSNAAQERIDVRLLGYDDAQAASAAFSKARSTSSCRPSPHDDAGGKPKDVAIEGASASFDIGFADENDASGFTVAGVGATVVVVESRLHHGAVKAEPLGSHAIARRVIALLR